MEHWANRSIRVVGRADSAYPRRLKQRPRNAAPPLICAYGNLELLNAPALAVVGSRNTAEPLVQQAEAVGALAAAAGGCAIGVVADSLEKVSARPLLVGQDLVRLSRAHLPVRRTGGWGHPRPRGPFRSQPPEISLAACDR